MDNRRWVKWTLVAVLSSAVPAGAEQRQRVAVFDASAAARALSPNIREALNGRPELEVVSGEHLIEWFGPCSLEPSEKCLRSASRTHHVDVVLRVWGSEGAGKLSVTVDRFEPKLGFVSTFEGSGVAVTDRPALKRLAELAVAKVMDGKDLPHATTATPEVLKPVPLDVPAATLPTQSVAPAASVAVAAPESGPSSMRIASYVIGGVGVAALGVGVVEALSVSAKNRDLSDNASAAHAGDLAAQARMRADLDAARSSAVIANVALLGGAAALATGVTLFILSPADDAAPKAAATIIDGKPGLVVAGRF